MLAGRDREVAALSAALAQLASGRGSVTLISGEPGIGKTRLVSELATMTRGACALLDNGWVKCWGHNGWGIAGQGHAANIGDGANEMGDALGRVPLRW